MAENERLQLILEFLRANQKASVEELARHLFISSASIRRDLTELQKRGYVKRTHGGVLLNDDSSYIPVNIRRTVNTIEKSRTADIAIRHLPEFTSVFFDDSSTAYIMADKMNLKGKRVATNGLQLASQLGNRGIEVILPGGNFNYCTYSINGALATENLRRMRFDLCIVSCAALNEENTYESTMDNASIKLNALTNSSFRMLIVDSTKLEKTALFGCYPLSSYDIICTDASDADIAPLRANANIINHD